MTAAPFAAVERTNTGQHHHAWVVFDHAHPPGCHECCCTPDALAADEQLARRWKRGGIPRDVHFLGVGGDPHSVVCGVVNQCGDCRKRRREEERPNASAAFASRILRPPVRYEPQFVQRHFRLRSGTSPFPTATMSAPESSRWPAARLTPDHQTVAAEPAPGR